MSRPVRWLAPFVFFLTCASASAAGPPGFKKAMVIVLENTDYEEALKQPFLSELARQGARFTNFSAEGRPSQPNYIAMIAGDTMGVTTNDNVDLEGPHLGDLLEAQGRSWKVYAEDYPGNCYLGATSGKYARRHVPFLSFTNVSRNPARCARVVDGRALDQDFASGRGLPDFSLYIPNNNNNGHDTNPAYADRWLRNTFGKKLQDPSFMADLLVVVTFDESKPENGSKRIYTVFLGPGVIPGSAVAYPANHINMLRTIEDAWGLGTLHRKDAQARSVTGIWK